MIPTTIHGLNAMECISGLQKCIRRGLEREAMEFAVELSHTSKAFHTMVCNRLEVILHEDVDLLGAPHLASMVHASLEMARAHYKPDKPQEARLMIATVVLALSRAPKSRAVTHFSAAVGLRSQQDDYKPVLPDWAFDMHTHKGKKMGRGLDHFLTEGSKMGVAPTPASDPYEAEAVARWRRKFGAPAKGQKALPFDTSDDDSGGETICSCGHPISLCDGSRPGCANRMGLLP